MLSRYSILSPYTHPYVEYHTYHRISIFYIYLSYKLKRLLLCKFHWQEKCGTQKKCISQLATVLATDQEDKAHGLSSPLVPLAPRHRTTEELSIGRDFWRLLRLAHLAPSSAGLPSQVEKKAASRCRNQCLSHFSTDVWEGDNPPSCPLLPQSQMYLSNAFWTETLMQAIFIYRFKINMAAKPLPSKLATEQEFYSSSSIHQLPHWKIQYGKKQCIGIGIHLLKIGIHLLKISSPLNVLGLLDHFWD